MVQQQRCAVAVGPLAISILLTAALGDSTDMATISICQGAHHRCARWHDRAVAHQLVCYCHKHVTAARHLLYQLRAPGAGPLLPGTVDRVVGLPWNMSWLAGVYQQ